jgi:molybdopterin synthase catalytic subunit
MKKMFAVTLALFTLLAFSNVHADQTATATVSDVEAGAQAGFVGDVGSNNTYEASDMNDGRGFAIPGDVQYGPVLNYFGQPLPSEGFQPVEQLIMYSCWYTEGSLKSLLKGVEKARAEFKVADTTFATAAPAIEDGSTKWIKIVVSRDKYAGANVDFKGFVTAKSDHKNTTMLEVMAKAALSAMENGCNVIHFSGQGAVRDVFSSGWGIGLNSTQAQIYSSGNDRSNVTTGGTGYSSAKAGTRDLAWLQGFGLIDRDLVYPALAVAPAAAPADAAPATTVVGDDGTVQSIVGGTTE